MRTLRQDHQPKMVRMRLVKVTTGAARYQELNEHGDEIGFEEGALMGILYLRKAALRKWLGNDKPPDALLVAITPE